MNKIQIEAEIRVLTHLKIERAREKERLSDVSIAADIDSFNKQITALQKQLTEAELPK